MPRFPLNHAMPPAQGLYHPSHEHDACGVGIVADIQGRRTRSILERALNCVCQLAHRGALDADAKSGDGAGILTQIPTKLFRREVEKLGHQLYSEGDLGIGFFFPPGTRQVRPSPHSPHCRGSGRPARSCFSRLACRPRQSSHPRRKSSPLRSPESNNFSLHDQMPRKCQMTDFEMALFLSRNEIEHRCATDRTPPFYIPSFSSRVIVYKGMLTGTQLKSFYLDLQDTCVRNLSRCFSSALQHKHLPHLAPRSPLPHGGSQRRNQYPPWQPALGPRPRGGSLESCPEPIRSTSAPPDHTTWRKRLLQPR